MARRTSGSSPPTGASPRAGKLHSTSQPNNEHKSAVVGTYPTKGASPATEAKSVKVRCRVSTDASANMSSSGRPMVRGIEGETAGTRRSSHSPVWSSGNKQVETRNERQSKINRLNGTANTQKWTRGVVYLGHIPSGFNEPQMLRFFSQFGEVGGVVLRRSRKTGHSKGYGYVGFEAPEVAEVVAETMNNYMMFGRTLACQVVAPARVPPRLFRNWGKKFRRRSTRIQAVQQHNKPENVLPSLRQVKRRLGNERKVAKHLKNLGLEHVASAFKDTVWKNNMANGRDVSEEICEPSGVRRKTVCTTLNTLCGVKEQGEKTGRNLAKKGR